MIYLLIEETHQRINLMERILTLHPEGKKGVNIDAGKYQQVKEAIILYLKEHPGITFTALNEGCTAMLKGNFDGVIGWYVISVQKDLEARGMIVRKKEKGKRVLFLT